MKNTTALNVSPVGSKIIGNDIWVEFKENIGHSIINLILKK